MSRAGLAYEIAEDVYRQNFRSVGTVDHALSAGDRYRIWELAKVIELVLDTGYDIDIGATHPHPPSTAPNTGETQQEAEG